MRLKEWRTRRVLTQAELAARSGVSKSTIIKAERGALAPHPSTLRKLAAALGIDPVELLVGDARERAP